MRSVRRRLTTGLRLGGAIASGAVAVVVVVAVTVWIFLRTTGPERVDPDVYQPLPEAFNEVLVEETGCNAAGPEPEYLVYHSVVMLEPGVADPLDAARDHLRDEGWEMSEAVGPHDWATFSGTRARTDVVVGSARSLARWDAVGDPSTHVASLLTGELERSLRLSDRQLEQNCRVSLRFAGRLVLLLSRHSPFNSSLGESSH